MPLRVFATARDVAAAQHLAALVRHGDPEVSFEILAVGAAADSLQAAGIEAERWTAEPDRRASLAALARRLEAAGADFLLAGMAYPGEGLDELAVRAARAAGVPSGAVQDYWGYLGAFAPDARPDMVFVLDEQAARLTEARLGEAVACHVTGSPKHECYRDHVARWEAAGRGRDGAPTVTLFCQPRFVPGTVENLRAVAGAFAALPAGTRIRVKLHPGDADAGFVAEAMALAAHRIAFADAGQTTEALLLESDLAVTHFSTVGLDHAYLQRYSDTPLGSVLYVTVGTEIARFIRERVGQDGIPLVQYGIGRQVREEGEIRPAIESLLNDPDAARRYRDAVMRALGTRPSPSSAVLAAVRRHVGAHRAARRGHLLET